MKGGDVKGDYVEKFTKTLKKLCIRSETFQTTHVCVC